MKTFKLDNKNNIVVNSNIVLLEGNDALLQDINTKLRLIKGEYPFNINDGIDYFNLIQNNNRAFIKEIIIKELLKDSRISQVLVDKLETKGNVLYLNIRIITIYGEVINV